MSPPQHIITLDDYTMDEEEFDKEEEGSKTTNDNGGILINTTGHLNSRAK